MSTKQTLIVNDLPGTGKVAGLINQAILAVCEIETAILPTLILNHHLASPFPIIQQEMGSNFEKMLQIWSTHHLSFDSILTGYFATPSQIANLIEFIELSQSKPKLFVDPIMGDDGHLYQGFDATIVEQMRALIAYAELVMPNVTEACLLTNQAYPQQLTPEFLQDLAYRVQALGPKSVVLTGIRLTASPTKIGCFVQDAQHKGILLQHPYVERKFYGTGDLTASIIVAAMTQGYSLPEACQLVVTYVYQAICDTVSDMALTRREIFYQKILVPLAQAIIGGMNNEENE